MSWKTEVQSDVTGAWVGNSLRFATKEEAEARVRALTKQWFAVRPTRVVESDEPTKLPIVNNMLSPPEKAKSA
jgi:hypothetical protein